MQFLSIPEDGQTWQEPLVYRFATGGDEPQDVKVEIYDNETYTLLATKMLYGVTEAEIDIAPYLRAMYDEAISVPPKTAIQLSPMTRYIGVGIGGIMSPQLRLSASAINLKVPSILSSTPSVQDIEYGDMILFSFYTPQTAKVVVTTYTTITSRRHEYTYSGGFLPLDMVIHTASLASTTVAISVDIYSGTQLFRTLRFNIVPATNHTQRLYWRNRTGGIESYSFPSMLRLATEATIDGFQTIGGYVSRLNHSTVRHRLCSAYEPEEELERIAGIIHSPYAYKSVGGRLERVDLDTRTIEYGSHGELRQVVVEISQRQEGGGL